MFLFCLFVFVWFWQLTANELIWFDLDCRLFLCGLGGGGICLNFGFGFALNTEYSSVCVLSIFAFLVGILLCRRWSVREACTPWCLKFTIFFFIISVFVSVTLKFNEYKRYFGLVFTFFQCLFKIFHTKKIYLSFFFFCCCFSSLFRFGNSHGSRLKIFARLSNDCSTYTYIYTTIYNPQKYPRVYLLACDSKMQPSLFAFFIFYRQCTNIKYLTIFALFFKKKKCMNIEYVDV